MGGSEDGGSAWCGSRGETGGYRSDSIDRNSSIGIEHGDGDDGWSYPGCCAGSGGGEFERDGGSAGTVAEWVGGAEYADGKKYWVDHNVRSYPLMVVSRKLTKEENRPRRRLGTIRACRLST